MSPLSDVLLMPKLTADQALQRLKEGHQKYLTENHSVIEIDDAKRVELAKAQEPFAIILGCSDSRVPAELIFNQGLGGLFVIRVAGNIVAPSQIGSIEFAADQFGTRLVVVLGHSRCGAISASMNLLLSGAEHASPNLDFIVSRIKPAIQNVVEETEGLSEEERMQAAVRANIRASVEQLRHGSEILEGLIANDGLRIVGAEYDLETGGIEFLDE